MTEHYIVTEDYIQSMDYLRRMPMEDTAAFDQYEQTQKQVIVAKGTPIERIYEGAEYIHDLHYPEDYAGKMEFGDEWQSHTKQINSRDYRLAVNEYDKRYLIPALNEQRSRILRDHTDIQDFMHTQAELSKVENELHHIYLRMVKNKFIKRSVYQTVLTLEKLEDLIRIEGKNVRNLLDDHLNGYTAIKVKCENDGNRYYLKGSHGISIESINQADSEIHLRIRQAGGDPIMLESSVPSGGMDWMNIVSEQSRKDILSYLEQEPELYHTLTAERIAEISGTHNPSEIRNEQEKEKLMNTYYRTTEEYTQKLFYQEQATFGSDGDLEYRHTDRQVPKGTPILETKSDILIHDLKYPEGVIYGEVDDTWRNHVEEIDEAVYKETMLTYDQEHVLPELYQSKQQIMNALEYQRAMDRAENIFFNDPDLVKKFWNDDDPPMKRDIPDILYKEVQESPEPSRYKDEIQRLHEVIARTEQDAYTVSSSETSVPTHADLEYVNADIISIEQRLVDAGRLSQDTFHTAHLLDEIDMLTRENIEDPRKLKKELNELLSDDIAHKHERHTNQVYHKYDTETYYLKNSNGVYVQLWRGGEINGEILGDRDIVLTINHPTLDYDIGVRYDIHEMPEHMDWMEFAGVMEGKDLQYQLTQKPFLYTTLNEELQGDSKTIQNTLSGLEEAAHEFYKEEMEYADISPNGGVDADLRTPAEHFLEDMKELSGYPALVEAGEQRLAESRMGREFLDARIEEDKMKLYYIDHADLYDELHKLELENIFTDSGLLHTRESLDTVRQDISKKQEKLKELQKVKDQLMNKRYRFWQFRQHRENTRKLQSIDKEIEHITEEIYEDAGLEQILEDKMPMLERYERLQAQLKAPYQDHMLGEAYDPVHGYRTSMDALCDHRTDIEQELERLEDVKSLQPFTKRLDIEIDIRQSDIANAKKQLLGLTETFDRVLEKPGVYDTRLTLTCNGRGYLKDRVLEDGEIEKLQESIASGHASPIIKQAQAILREDHHMEDARELSSFARQIDRESIIEESFSAEIQTTLAPAF